MSKQSTLLLGGLFTSPSNPRHTVRLKPQLYPNLYVIIRTMDRVEHKLAFRAQLYLYSFAAIALSLLLVVLCHWYLPALAAGLSLLTVAATCMFAALVVLWFDRRISNSVRGELGALKSELDALGALMKESDNGYKDKKEKELNIHTYLEGSMTLLFQSQAIPNKGGNFMKAGYECLAELARYCEGQREWCLSYDQMHELYKVLCGHSKAFHNEGHLHGGYQVKMAFFHALKRFEAHNKKLEAAEAEPQSKEGGWFKVPKFWRKGVLAYHRVQRDAMKARVLQLLDGGNGLEELWPQSRFIDGPKGRSAHDNCNDEKANDFISSSATVKSIFLVMGSSLDQLDVGMEYLKHGFVNRVFHELTSVGKGVKGAVELLTPNKHGKHSK